MSNYPKEITPIGFIFSSKELDLLALVLSDSKYNFSGDGTSASGYEIYVATDMVPEVIKKINSDCRLKKINIELYDKIQSINETTRYERILNYLKKT